MKRTLNLTVMITEGVIFVNGIDFGIGHIEREIPEKNNHSAGVNLTRVGLEESSPKRGDIEKLFLLKTVYEQDKEEQLNKERERREMLAVAMSFKKLGR